MCITSGRRSNAASNSSVRPVRSLPPHFWLLYLLLSSVADVVCLSLIILLIFNLRDVMISAVGLWAAAMSVVRQVVVVGGGVLISGEN